MNTDNKNKDSGPQQGNRDQNRSNSHPENYRPPHNEEGPKEGYQNKDNKDNDVEKDCTNEAVKAAANRDHGPSLEDLENRWKKVEGAYREQHPDVTNEDVNYRPGQFDNMIDCIAKRTHRSRQEVADEIRNWEA